MNWCRRLFSDPVFCRACGQRLRRGESANFDPRTGESRPLPHAACPTLVVMRYVTGYWVTGGFPEHTVIFHAPRWPEEPPE